VRAGLREHADVRLVEQPAQRDLRRRLAVRGADLAEHRVVEQRAVGERRVRLEQQVALLGLGEQRGLREVRVVLDLVGEDRRDLQRLLDQPRREVADADVADQALLAQVVECAERLLERHLGVRPVQEVEVEVLEAELLDALLGRAAQAVALEGARPHLGRDPELLARDAAGRDPAPTSRSFSYARAVSMWR
jgi:hypothetical protein